ncbi:MAG: DUF2442 domain-containing protein [Candidatus Aureabacteria bacterium]|nr:DUF2442 domain-containing protein [Candidatus Auribacterota bacterium]
MILHVKVARHLHDYVLWVKFNDGAEGTVDLAGELDGEVFGALKDLAVFRAFRVDPVLETVVWPNGADLAPEFLYEKMKRPSRGKRAKVGKEDHQIMAREGKKCYKISKGKRKVSLD